MKKRCLLTVVIFHLIAYFVTGQNCNENLRPVILIHGFLGAGDNYGSMVHQLTEAGYCRDRCFVFDWNSLERTDQTLLLDKIVDSVLDITQARQVDLVGHSAGGGIVYKYLDDSVRSKKVNRYVHIASSIQKGAAGKNGSIPTLNIFSSADRVVKGGEISGAINRQFTRYDHFEIVTADSVAIAVFEFLNPGKKLIPKKLKVVPHNFSVKGKVIALGQNKPLAAAKLIVRKVHADGTPGQQVAETYTTENGSYQVDNLEPYEPYLFYCFPVSGRAMVYYFSKIAPGESLLYLRTIPNEGLVGTMLGSLPADSTQSVMAIFSSQKAIISGRDELTINEYNVCTDAFASPSKTAIAWFLFDGNKNGQSDFSPIPPLSNFPFMQAVDMLFVPGQTSTTIRFGLNEFKVPAIPASKAIVVVVL